MKWLSKFVICGLICTGILPENSFSQPPIPHGFWGTVKIDGTDAPVGTIISPTINGVTYPSSDTLDVAGQYGLLFVNGDDPSTGEVEGGKNGDTIVFKAKVGNQEIVLSPTAIWQSGATTQLNLSGSSAIPVELASFEAIYKSGKIFLKWLTLSESNNYGFEILRKINDSNYEKIAFVKGHGTVAEPHEYEFLDIAVSQGRYYYRLRQIDIDGSINLSPVCEVDVISSDAFKIIGNFPNPFNPATKIVYQINQPMKIEIAIFNSLGQQVRILKNQFQVSGVHEVLWDGTDTSGNPVSTGDYFCLFRTERGTSVKKMLLLR